MEAAAQPQPMTAANVGSGVHREALEEGGLIFEGLAPRRELRPRPALAQPVHVDAAADGA